MWTYRKQAAQPPLLESLEPRLLLAADWTVLVYLDADNNLESAGIDDVNEMEQVGSTPEVNLVVQFDRYVFPWGYVPSDDVTNGNWTDTRRGLIVQDTDPLIISSTLTSIGEANMGSPDTLRDFIVWGTTTYPADHYALVMWDHGGGTWGLCVDDESWDMMAVEDVGVALNQAGVHMDVVAFDCCLMGMMEVAHEIAPYADVMVGSEESVPWDGFPYDTIAADMVANPGWTAAEVADSMVTRYGQSYSGWDVTLSSADLGETLALSAAVDGLVDAILTERADLNTTVTARAAAEVFGGEFYDLGTFLDRMATLAGNSVIQAAAANASAQYGATILSNFTDGGLDGTGLSIYFPGVGDTIDPYYVRSNFTFLADTSWREFLNCLCNPAPEITVLDGATSIPDGQTAPIDFGTVLGSTPYVSRTFTIRNDGVGALNLGAITVPNGFVMDEVFATSLPPGSSVPLRVSLVTDVPGSYSGDVVIANNDFDEAPFNFAISGEVLASGEVVVLYGGTEIADGETVPLDFGNVVQHDPVVEQIFTIRNDGPGDLVIRDVSAPAGFIVTQPADELLASGEATTFGMTLNSAMMGVHVGEVLFYNSDGDESPFNFAITATVRGPDLVVANVGYTPGLYAIGKDAICLNTCMCNVGMAPFRQCHSVQIEAHLSIDTVWGNADDITVYRGDHHLLDLGVGEDSRWHGQTLRTSFMGAALGSYHVAVMVNCDGAVDEMDPGNNVWWSAAADVELYPSHLYTRLTNRTKVVFEDDAGQKVTASFSGPGYADIRVNNGLTGRNMAGDLQTIVFGNTTEASQLKISVRGGTTSVENIVARGPLKAITGKGVTVTGDIEIAGTISKIVLGDIADGHTISIGAPDPADARAAVTLSLGRVEETTIISATPIKSLTVTEWLDQDGTPDLLQAPWIGKLTTKGDRRSGLAGHFQASLLLDGVGAGKATLGRASIAGDLREADWDITGDMGKLRVGGTAADSSIRTTGSMAGVQLGAADGADFLAGIDTTAVTRHAADLAHFLNPLASIGSFKIKGLRDGGATRWYFQNSNLSAHTIGKVDLMNVNFDNGGTGFGLYAVYSRTNGGIRSVRYADTVTGERWSWPQDADHVAAIPDLEIALLS